MIPKTKKLQMEEEFENMVADDNIQVVPKQVIASGPIRIRRIQTLNDFVAILQFQIETGSIELPESTSKYKNEGMVVGIGPGVYQGANRDILNIGDVVVFGAKNIITNISSDSPPYKGRNIVIVSERNIICKLPVSPEWVEDA